MRCGRLRINGTAPALPVRVHRCDTALRRLRGRILAPEWRCGDAWHLEPCRAVHTFLLAAPIDVIFCAGDGRVLRVVVALPPRRAALCARARSAWELPAGMAAQLGLKAGDRLAVAPCS